MAMSKTMAPLLLVAAEAREFAGLRAHLGSGRKLDWPVDFSRAVQNGQQEWLLVANGPGPRLAQQAAAVAHQRATLSGIVNIGFCGGLDPALSIGEVFVASEVDSGGQAFYPVALPQARLPFAEGRLASMDRVVVGPEERASLWHTGARVVEMEAAGLASFAAEHALPFFCVRAISDAGEETLPLDFNLMRRADGRFSKGRIIGHALCRPRTLLPALMRLNRQAGTAARRLGDFLVDCEF